MLISNAFNDIAWEHSMFLSSFRCSCPHAATVIDGYLFTHDESGGRWRLEGLCPSWTWPPPVVDTHNDVVVRHFWVFWGPFRAPFRVFLG